MGVRMDMRTINKFDLQNYFEAIETDPMFQLTTGLHSVRARAFPFPICACVKDGIDELLKG